MCSHLKPQNLQMWPYLKKMIFAYVIWVSCNEIILDYPGGPKYNDQCLYKRYLYKRHMEKTSRSCEDWGSGWSCVAIDQGMSGATRAGRGKEQFSPKVLGESCWFIISDFWTHLLGNNQFPLFYAIIFVIIIMETKGNYYTPHSHLLLFCFLTLFLLD